MHGWDVATATGQEFRVSDGAARLVLDVVETHGDLYRQYDGFADPVAVPADAPAFERALAASGRDPRRPPWATTGDVGLFSPPQLDGRSARPGTAAQPPPPEPFCSAHRRQGRQRRHVVPLQEHPGHLRRRAEHIGEDVRLGCAPCDAVRQEAGGQDVAGRRRPARSPGRAARVRRPRCGAPTRRRTQVARRTNRCAATPARFLRSLRSPPGPWTPPRPVRPRSRTCRRATTPPRTNAVRARRAAAATGRAPPPGGSAAAAVRRAGPPGCPTSRGRRGSGAAGGPPRPVRPPPPGTPTPPSPKGC